MLAQVLDAAFDGLVAGTRPLDALRSRVLHELRGPLLRELLRARDLRIGVLGVSLAFAICALVLVAPYAVALVGPLVFGVPHVLADVRYLVARPGLAHHRWTLGVVALGTVVAAVVGSRATFLTLVVLALGGRGRPLFRVALLTAASISAWAAFASPKLADLVFAHAHHLISFVLFATFWRRGRASLVAITLAVGVVVVSLASGMLDGALASAFAEAEVPMDAPRYLRSIALGTKGPIVHRIASCFLFAQAFHYALWLRLIPEADRERRAPRSFRASLQALRADVGAPLVLLAAVATLSVLAFAAWGADASRSRYVWLASFHGHLELLAAVAWALRARVGAHALGVAGEPS